MDEAGLPSYLLPMNDRSPLYDLCIVGAGPVGSSLALLAAQAGYKTVLIDGRDASAPAKRDPRTFAVVRGSWNLLQKIGVADALASISQPLLGLEAVDGGTHWFGEPYTVFDADDLGDGKPIGQMVPAGKLQAELDAATAARDGLTVLRGVWFETLTAEPALAKITLADGTEITARLLAACDGVKSPVRTAAGIGVETRTYGKSVFAADVQLENEHNGVARQLFTPEGPFATLPLPGNRANLAWYMKEGAAEALAQFEPERIDAELNERFADFAGPMELIGDPLTYPLHMVLAQSMYADRVALVGDAARRINPLAGQGLNLGFKDVAALIEAMSNARSVGLDIGSHQTLKAYSVARRFDANATALFIDGVDRVFSNDNPILKPLRGAALEISRRLPPLRRALTRQASAATQNLPSTMRDR